MIGKYTTNPREHVFEAMSDVDLIDVMGEATRDESTAIAQRLAGVAELYVRRSGALADCEWACADACDAVAAEVSAVQNISHARAVGQVAVRVCVVASAAEGGRGVCVRVD